MEPTGTQQMSERGTRAPEASSPTPTIAEIAREHYDVVFRFCARRVGADIAADAAQNTFLTAQRALGKFRGESAIRTWLLGIANNECRRIVRDRRLAPPTVELDTDRACDADSEKTLVNREMLRSALSKLSDEHREAVLLHEVEGLSYDEAALVLGVPAGTVKSRLHHAFQNLRKHLSGDSI